MSIGKQMFRGDAECLVDMLIQASQARPQAVPQLEGRELVKWCDDSFTGVSSALLDGPLEASNNRRQQQQQYVSGGKFPARQQARSPTAAAAAAAAHYNSSSASKRGSRASSTSPAQIPRAATGAAGRRMSADYSSNTTAGFACPAVAASPKPEALPMPTGLMSRALAVRSRSPSPPKDGFFAVSVLAHVHPVAA